MAPKEPTIFFLHGLESSGNGTKGQYFSKHFPDVQRPDFNGNLEARLTQLKELCADERELIFVGSSYGGLMGTCFASQQQEKVKRLILLAPALNFESYSPPVQPLNIPTLVVIGRHDDVTPIDPVVSLAEKSFSKLKVWVCEDDHMLHSSFYELDWPRLLAADIDFSRLMPPEGIEKG